MKNEKILLIQLRRLRPVFYTELRGRVFKKGNRGVSRAIKQLQNQIKRDVKTFSWNILPRARVSVHISLFPSSIKVAGIQDLVKFYLDLLKGTIFKDDRQVHYLSAACYRAGTEKGEGKVFIKVERFCDLINRYEI
jgi:Holliday junction resolvase RusA-like endonuclease